MRNEPVPGLADPTRRHRPFGMRIPYFFGPLPVIGDNARSVASRAATFILSALINNTFSVAFRAEFFSHLCALPGPRRRALSRPPWRLSYVGETPSVSRPRGSPVGKRWMEVGCFAVRGTQQVVRFSVPFQVRYSARNGALAFSSGGAVSAALALGRPGEKADQMEEFGALVSEAGNNSLAVWRSIETCCALLAAPLRPARPITLCGPLATKVLKYQHRRAVGNPCAKARCRDRAWSR
jgi:hypothetical protein